MAPREVLGVPVQRIDVEVAGVPVQLWLATLPDVAPPAVLVDALAPDERERVARLRIAERARDTVWSRLLLRGTLAVYLECEIATVSLVIGERGKPLLDDAGHAGAVHFNVSHSGRCWVAAVSSARAVGVDVERLRPLKDTVHLAERALAWPDLRRYQMLIDAGESPSDAFLRVWTAVEARAKALGTGVEVHGGRLVSDLEGVPWRWVEDERLGRGLVGAVAVLS